MAGRNRYFAGGGSGTGLSSKGRGTMPVRWVTGGEVLRFEERANSESRCHPLGGQGVGSGIGGLTTCIFFLRRPGVAGGCWRGNVNSRGPWDQAFFKPLRECRRRWRAKRVTGNFWFATPTLSIHDGVTRAPERGGGPPTRRWGGELLALITLWVVHADPKYRCSGPWLGGGLQAQVRLKRSRRGGAGGFAEAGTLILSPFPRRGVCSSTEVIPLRPRSAAGSSIASRLVPLHPAGKKDAGQRRSRPWFRVRFVEDAIRDGVVDAIGVISSVIGRLAG